MASLARLRARDVVALLAACWLVRMAWNDADTAAGQDSLSTSMRLAFYAHISQSVVAPFDIDGDGNAEALAVLIRANTTSSAGSGTMSRWEVQLLDLKPLHQKLTVASSMAPFRPRPIMSSSTIMSLAQPLKLISGQIMIDPPNNRNNNQLKKDDEVKLGDVDKSKLNDRTRRYFCGTDWHDAANKCSTPCPGGMPSECPGDEKCYADTPCDALNDDNSKKPQSTNNADAEEEEDSKLRLTPSGGLPCVVSLWQDGNLRMHALKPDKTTQRLHLEEMWTHKIRMGFLEEYDLLLLGSEDVSGSDSDLGKNGVVIVGGTTQQFHKSTVIAIDALSGQPLWNTREIAQQQNEQQQEEKDGVVEKPTRGNGSYARRRSRIATEVAPGQEGGGGSESATPNCWLTYRHSLLEDVMPFAYWGPGDRQWTATHLDRTPKRKNKKTWKKWHHRHKRGPIRGRPNVLIGRTRNGLMVRSLKNGRSICHLSLLDKTLYGDLNQDGTLDQLQVLTDSNPIPEDRKTKWVESLTEQLSKDKTPEASTTTTSTMNRLSASSRLCHVMALAGMPPREEIFSASLCGNHHQVGSTDLFAAKPSVVVDKRGGGGDVVVALSNGMVSRYHVATGRLVWQRNDQARLPTWGAYSDTAVVAPLTVKRRPTATSRPLLLSGETGMALLSANRGKVLAATKYPQTARGRPMLVDVSGDGTDDVIVVTNDALWGYHVVVTHGGASGSLLRILVGLLLVLMALALVRNRYNRDDNNNNNNDDKRSTDA